MALSILPTTYLTNVTRTAVNRVAISRSPWNATVQVQHLGGEFWQYELDFALQPGVSGRAMSGFLAGLRGPATEFIFKDPAEFNSASLGTPAVNGADQTGYSLVTDGWNVSTTVLAQGQFITLGTDATTRLHQVTSAVESDVSGNATIPIWPALRASPADNAALTIDEPAVRLRLAAPVPTRIMPHVAYAFTISAEEAL